MNCEFRSEALLLKVKEEQVGAPLHAEFGEQIANVELDRPLGNMQQEGDLLVRHSERVESLRSFTWSPIGISP